VNPAPTSGSAVASAHCCHGASAGTDMQNRHRTRVVSMYRSSGREQSTDRLETGNHVSQLGHKRHWCLSPARKHVSGKSREVATGMCCVLQLACERWNGGEAAYTGLVFLYIRVHVGRVRARLDLTDSALSRTCAGIISRSHVHRQQRIRNLRGFHGVAITVAVAH
jgi:hypothetical protein